MIIHTRPEPVSSRRIPGRVVLQVARQVLRGAAHRGNERRNRVGAKTGNKSHKNLKPLLDPAGRPGWVCEGLVCRGRSGVGVGAKVSSRGGFASEKRPELVQLSVLFPQELLPLVLLLHPQGGVVTGADLLPAGGGGSGEGTQLLEAKRDGIGGVGGGWLEHPTRWLGAQWPGLSPPLGVPSCQARPRAAQVPSSGAAQWVGAPAHCHHAAVPSRAPSWRPSAA